MHFQLVLAAVGSFLMVTNAAQLHTLDDNENRAHIGKRAPYDDVGQGNMSEDDKAEYLSIHRTIRSNIAGGASDMGNIEWDDDLASIAQSWVKKCYFEHPDPDYSEEAAYDTDGQNLYRIWAPDSREDRKPIPTDIVNRWLAENQWYDIVGETCNAPSGKTCNHYLQLAWSTMSKVGCGMAFCDEEHLKYRNGVKIGYKAWLIACDYDTGVTYNVAPYTPGSACTKCKSGKFYCKDNMCVDSSCASCTCEADCNGSNGVLQTDTCSCNCNAGFNGVDCSA